MFSCETWTSACGGEIRQHKPVIYQEVGGVRKPIQGGYELLGNDRVRFQLAKYDRAHNLVIDPTLVYSTFLGGRLGGETGRAIAADADGYAYLTGFTTSGDFPTSNAYQPACAAGFADVGKLIDPSSPAAGV